MILDSCVFAVPFTASVQTRREVGKIPHVRLHCRALWCLH